MPELLEVEVYRRQAERVVGRSVGAVDALDAWYLKGSEISEVVDAVTGRAVAGVRRRGKLLVLDLGDPAQGVRLGLRFGMTGRLLVDGAAGIDRLEYSSPRDDPAWDRFALRFTGGGDLRVSDPRRLGGVSLDPDEDRLGVDALAATREDLVDAVGAGTTPVKARLLDQARLAGVGNLLADEVLWRAGLDPVRPAGGLDGDELSALHRALGEVLAELATRGGSHMGDLRRAAALGGLCPRDGAALVRRHVGGRTTWSCPAHQR